MTNNNWQIVSAVATVFAATGTFVLAGVAIVQLRALRKQLKSSTESERRLHTLEVCSRYENNDKLREAMQRIWDKSKNETDYTLLESSDEFDTLTILNYLSGVASGIEQGVIIEPLAKDYLHHSICKSVKALIKGESGPGWQAEKSIISPDGFESLIRVYEAWSRNEPAYNLSQQLL